MTNGKGWKKLLPQKHLHRVCRWGIGLCVVMMLMAGLRLLTTVSMLLTTYVLWTRKMIFLFSCEAVLTISMAVQIAAYAYLWKKKKRQTEVSLTRGLQLLSAAHIGKVTGCLLLTGECWWMGSSPVLMQFYQQTLNITVPDLMLVAGWLMSWACIYGFKLLVLQTIRKSLSGTGRVSPHILRLTSYAVILQYILLVVFAAVMLLRKTDWPILFGLVPFLLLVFFYYFDMAGCYYDLSQRLIRYAGKERTQNAVFHP